MANPQIGMYTPEVPAEGAMPRRIIPSLSGISIGEGVKDIGHALDQIQQQNGTIEASKTMATARAQWSQQLIDRQNSYKDGDDFTGQLGKDFNDYKKQALKQTSNPYARQMLDQGLTDLGSNLTQRGLQFQAKAQVDTRVKNWQDGAEQAKIAVNLDPSQFDQAYGEQLSALNDLKVDPDTKSQLATQLRSQMSLAAGKALGERDPNGTLLALSKKDTGNTALNRLSLDERTQVQDHILTVQRLKLSQESHDLAMEERLQKKASDNLAKQGDDLLASGQMTPKWLHDHQSILEPGEYRYFSRKLAGDDGPAKESDPSTFADLLLRSQSGDDVRDEARQALLDGKLKPTDFAKIAGDVAAERPGWYKRGSSYLSEALNPGQLNPDPAASRSKANALADWQAWGATHPKPTDAEAQKQAELIAQHYQIIPQDKTVLGMRAPRFLTGTRLNPTDEKGNPDPTLQATAKKTLDALRNGEITEDEAQREALLIQQYRRAYVAKAAQKKPQP